MHLDKEHWKIFGECSCNCSLNFLLIIFLELGIGVAIVHDLVFRSSDVLATTSG